MAIKHTVVVTNMDPKSHEFSSKVRFEIAQGPIKFECEYTVDQAGSVQQALGSAAVRLNNDLAKLATDVNGLSAPFKR
jgi:hypothetical protein